MSIQTLWLPPFAALMVVAAAASLEAQVESVGKVTLASGPHAGVYTVESPTPCEIKPARQDSPAEFGSNVATDEAIRERLATSPRCSPGSGSGSPTSIRSTWGNCEPRSSSASQESPDTRHRLRDRHDPAQWRRFTLCTGRRSPAKKE